MYTEPKRGLVRALERTTTTAGENGGFEADARGGALGGRVEGPQVDDVLGPAWGTLPQLRHQLEGVDGGA